MRSSAPGAPTGSSGWTRNSFFRQEEDLVDQLAPFIRWSWASTGDAEDRLASLHEVAERPRIQLRRAAQVVDAAHEGGVDPGSGVDLVDPAPEQVVRVIQARERSATAHASASAASAESARPGPPAETVRGAPQSQARQRTQPPSADSAEGMTRLTLAWRNKPVRPAAVAARKASRRPRGEAALELTCGERGEQPEIGGQARPAQGGRRLKEVVMRARLDHLRQVIQLDPAIGAVAAKRDHICVGSGPKPRAVVEHRSRGFEHLDAHRVAGVLVKRALQDEESGRGRKRADQPGERVLPGLEVSGVGRARGRIRARR